MRPKKAGFITKTIIAAVIIYALINLITLRTQLAELTKQSEDLTAEADSLTQSNAEYLYGIEHSNDPETIEDIARSKLGLVSPGEKVFYDSSK